ncbi:MAG: Re/Si-specific NAD(P)(+) transhydrogenase subunit alpha [Bacteroidota bacterium]
MKLGVLKENHFKRVAVVPESIPKLDALGIEVLLEKDAGINAFHSNQTYQDKGASLHDRKTVIEQADVIVSIAPLEEAELKNVPKGKHLIAQFEPYNQPEIIDQLKALGLHAFSMDMIPRTTLAQSMDVLSSMASVSGYRSVLEAASHIPRYFPMLITAAGSVKPSRVLVLGAGVAGLQAIATARRLGAMVEAFDTRAAAKEEVLSLGAKFVEVEGAADDTGAGGYAVQQSEDYLRRQREEVQNRAMKADVIITTAQVRGRKAPLLVPSTTVAMMKPGSVIVDLAASTGGNCELSKDNEVVNHNGVTIVGNSHLSDKMPQDASLLYSTNVLNFVKILVKEGALHIDMDNEIVSSSLITAEKEAEQS